MKAPAPLSKEEVRRRRSRNWAIFFSLLFFVGLVYAITIVKIKLGYEP